MKASENKDIIYLDNAATSWPKPDSVAEAMSDMIKCGCANPGRSGHRMSVDTARAIFLARDAVASLIGSPDPLSIAFCGNATMALNIAINGIVSPGDHVITTSMEHNSVMRPLRALETGGAELTVVQCASEGSVDPRDIEKAVRVNTRAIVVTHASNVTGTIMPVDEIANIARASGITLIVDGAQSAGVVPVNVVKSGIDILAFTGHKGLYGPQGTGGLYIRRGLEKSVRAVFSGGTGSQSEKEEQPDFMPDKFEPGTQNSPGITGLGAGLEFIRSVGIDEIVRMENILTDKFINGLLSIKGVTLYGLKKSQGRTSVVSVNVNGRLCSEVSQMLDEDFGILTRPGLHCAPAAHRTIGTSGTGTVRFSFGYFNTDEHVDKALKAVEIIAMK